MSALHYVTFKYVVIKDRRLGAAYYVVLVLILLYTLAQIFVHKAYLEVDLSPRSALRLVVTRPPVRNEDNYYSLDYCCKNASLHHKGKDPKLSQSSCGTCKRLDAISLNWPVESKAVSIATFIKEVYEETGRIAKNPEKFFILRQRAYFSVNPEDVLFKIEHSMSAFSDNGGLFAASHRMMKGKLLGPDRKTLLRLSNGTDSKVDKIRLHHLLAAANITSLDKESDALNANGRTYRENGLILRVNIHYDNTKETLIGISPIQYTYRVERAPYSDYRAKKEIPILGPGDVESPVRKRLVEKRYCTRVEFTQTGKIGKFSLANFLLQLVASMGLLTLSATIIDTVALYVVPAKETYRKYVYDSSPDLHTPEAHSNNMKKTE